MATRKKKKKTLPLVKTFRVTLEIEFTGPKAGADKRMLDWLLSKDSGTMPEDFQLVKVVRSEETELSKAMARTRANSKQEEKLDAERAREKRKAARQDKKTVKEKRAAIQKKARKRAKQQ